MSNLRAKPSDIDESSVSGKLLIATPAMSDPRFDRAVILMCNHDDSQAFGIVINRPFISPRLRELLAQLDVSISERVPDEPVLEGGPVDTQRGFVIHSAAYFETGASIKVQPNIAVTPTKGVLGAMASDAPPKHAQLALGYAGWGAGQLDAELKQNAWLIAQASEALVFLTAADAIWKDALASLGIKPEMLSALSGNA